MKSRFHSSLHAAAAVSALAISAPALGQEADAPAASGGIDEIVITAQKRAQNLQEVPISVTAFNDTAIREAGFTNSLSIGDQVPNLEIKTFGGVPNIFIRGVGNNDFNASSIGPISIYRDDVVVASTGSQIFSLFDLERIEVVRGPQGTLFGKNTTGGAIQFFSKLPGDEFEGNARFGYGRFDLFEAEAAASLPLGEGLSLRVAGMVRRRDGEKTNLYTGDDAINVDEAAARAILRWRPSADTDVRLSVGGGRDRSDYLENKPVGTINGADLFGYTDPYPDDANLLNFNGPSRNYSDNLFVNLNIAHSFGDFTFKSITGYDKSDVDNRVDVDGGPFRIDEITFLTDAEQITQEFQLAYDSGPFNAIGGLYYFQEDLDADSNADLLGELSFADGALPLITRATRKNKAYAIFGQATYAVSPALRFTLGGRYTIDKVRVTHQADLVPGFFDADIPDGAPVPLVPFARLKDTFKSFSWRIGADYDITDDVLAYASIDKGFKAGGFNIGIITSVAERTQVDPEYLTSYEIGLKSTLFDRRLRLNISAFYYDYTDLQVLSVNRQAGSTVPTLGLDNAADAEIKGIELEATALPTDWLDLGLNLGILDAKYKNYLSGAIDPDTGDPRDFSGNRLPGAPKFTLSTFAQVTIPVGDFETRWRAEYNYTGKKYYNNAQSDLISSGEGYGLLNLRATLADPAKGWELAAWAKNVTGKAYIVDATDTSGFGFVPRYYGERATYGVELSFRF
ncbi:TonB-dependent receptor [Sphingosinicella sp.]|uniref:TonB-dependent receptor n=1 Tax=Sphingosinicella sp. TaxID=1917971 RepID=UPI00179FC163|nr:TonB-dependent receptor [Sphingosinicella sp.]MBA4759459.1 TonB-dependent receptor [Sphingosinicella sp.]